MRTINFSEARSNLKNVLDRVVDDADVTIITRRDADDVVVMSLSEYNSWKETEYLLASPANARHLRESIARLDAGKKLYRDLIEPTASLAVRERKTAYRVKSKSKQPAARARGRSVARRLAFDPVAWEHYCYWHLQDRKTFARLNELIRATLRDPFTGIGKPEPLKGELAGFWSRRIDQMHRLVYRAHAGDIEIVACRYHYGAR